MCLSSMNSNYIYDFRCSCYQATNDDLLKDIKIKQCKSTYIVFVDRLFTK